MSCESQDSKASCRTASAEAIRKSAARSRLHVEEITQLRVLDPCSYPEQSKGEA
jgi:hypothetical protein